MKTRLSTVLFTLVLCTVVGFLAYYTLSTVFAAGTLTRIVGSSVGSSLAPMSDDGRYVALADDGTLIADDTTPFSDIFLYDQQTEELTLLSVASDGTQGNGYSDAPAIAGNGRFVAFVSWANNLVSGDTNNQTDVFVHDYQTGETTRVSVASDGTQTTGGSEAPSLSDNGRYVAFESWANNLVIGDTNGNSDVFVHDRQTGETTRVSVATAGTQANGGSFAPSLSDDGRYVAFESWANNLVSGDTNGNSDVFVHDHQTGETTRVSVASDGTQADDFSSVPVISRDGRYVAFESWASNLVSGDTNNWPDIFVHDRLTGETTRVSVASDGTQANGDSSTPSLSDNGRYVVFASEASNLVSGDTNAHTDIFLHDRQTGETTRISISADGTEANGTSGYPFISGNGRYISFDSAASNLVAGDTNGLIDLFIADRNTPPTISAIADQQTNEDSATDPIAFTIGDAETTAADLTLTATSNNTALVPDENIVFGGSGANRTVTVTPAANATGNATLTIMVQDAGERTATTSFLLTVTGDNDAPTISTVDDQTIDEDTVTDALAFTVGDAEAAAADLTVSATSSNTDLVPDENIVVEGSGADRTLTITPATDQNGSTTITILVSDGDGGTTTETFTLTVTPVNDAPTISTIDDQTIDEDEPTVALPFTIGDDEIFPRNLVVRATADNTTLVPADHIVIEGNDAERTVTITPAANESGSATITIVVSDGTTTTQTSFTVTVAAVNDAPTISDIADQQIDVGEVTDALAFTVGDVETPVDDLTIGVTSSNPTLVPDDAIALEGSGADRTLTITPAAGQTGETTISVSVTDGDGSTTITIFTLTVTSAENTPPTISDIENQTIEQDAATRAISLTISDAETDADNLILTGSSDNPTLVPDSGIVFGGSGSQRTVTITPAAGETGEATITLIVSDGDGGSASEIFTLTVGAAGSDPDDVQPGHISGTVANERGAPLAGIAVQVYEQSGVQWDAARRVLTEQDGSYRLEGLSTGTYRIGFIDPAGEYLRQYFDGAASFAAAADITVEAATTPPDIDAVLTQVAPEPAAEVTTTCGSPITIDPATGLVTIMQRNGPTTCDVTLETQVFCPAGADPAAVTLQMQSSQSGNPNRTYPMATIDDNTYQVTIPRRDLSNLWWSSSLNVTWTCGGEPQEYTLGSIILYDPSGIITDAETGDPISDATVVLHQVPGWEPRTTPDDTRPDTCESNVSKAADAPWSQPAPTEQGVIVDAEVSALSATPIISPTLNPQVTGTDGYYGWDVAQGCWYVEVRAAGYATTVSPVVGVPPEVIDLDVALEPLPGNDGSGDDPGDSTDDGSGDDTDDSTPDETDPPDEPDTPVPGDADRQVYLPLIGR